MMQEISILKTLIDKIAAKRFSKKEKIILLMGFIVFSGCLLFYIQNWINTFKDEAKVIEPIAPKYTLKASVKMSEQIKHALNETSSLFKKSEIRDPFLASKDSNIISSVSRKPVINLKLKGILWDKLVPSAIINSKVVKIGDLIFGKTVVDIEKDQVIMMENGEILILKLIKK